MLKKLKTKNIYKNSTGTNYVNADNLTAISYDWWTYLKIIDGKLTFNQYKYSVTTSKHQRETLNLLATMNIRPDVFVSQKESL